MTDQEYMQLALEEAAKGLGRTAPNPAVGAVVVKNGKVIAKGYHRKAGGPHAEVAALRKAKGAAKGATLYVTLEPCSHTGKTPPCVKAIVDAGIKKVVVGMKDPHSLVNGRGLRQLRAAKVAVKSGVLKEECEAFYQPYTTFVKKKRPFVTLKAAASLDGMIATASGESRWISSPEAREHAHQLRDQVDGILVGRETVQADDPRLTTRLSGKKKSHDPVRIVLDSRLRISAQSRVLKVRSEAPAWLITTDDATRIRERHMLESKNVEVIRCRANPFGRIDIKYLLRNLAKRGIMHLLVEGGPTVYSRFIERRLVDRLSLYLAPKFLGGKGMPLLPDIRLKALREAISLQEPQIEWIGPDLWLEADL